MNVKLLLKDVDRWRRGGKQILCHALIINAGSIGSELIDSATIGSDRVGGAVKL